LRLRRFFAPQSHRRQRPFAISASSMSARKLFKEHVPSKVQPRHRFAGVIPGNWFTCILSLGQLEMARSHGHRLRVRELPRRLADIYLRSKELSRFSGLAPVALRQGLHPVQPMHSGTSQREQNSPCRGCGNSGQYQGQSEQQPPPINSRR